MSRFIWILIILLGMLTSGWLITRFFQPAELSQVVPGVYLTNRPSSYCPKKADLAIFDGKKLISSASVAVTVCQRIDWPANLEEVASPNIIIKLSHALAFSVPGGEQQKGIFEQPIKLGDATDDNIIDHSDLDLITLALQGKGGNNLDIDGDDKISALDLALAKVNQGVGAERPDGKSYKVED